MENGKQGKQNKLLICGDSRTMDLSYAKLPFIIIT